jgi:hypothetical protein
MGFAMSDFLKNIDFLSEEEKIALKETGADTPLALESALHASSEAYKRFLGEAHFQALIEELKNEVTTDNPMGVPLDERAPTIVKSREHESRDQIYAEIRRLQGRSDLKPEEKERLKRLENKLIQILENLAA